MLKVTLDTNILPADDMVQLCCKMRVDIRIVTVTVRELSTSDIEVNLNALPEIGVFGESTYGQAVYAANPAIPESFVLGETPLGTGIIGNNSSEKSFESLLKIISNGSFPTKGKRENLDDGSRRQLRDAMIFEAHVRGNRDIFVSNDKRAFIGQDGSIRATLEKVFNTKIFKKDEFMDYLREL